uniref:Taperin isoform X2 n=1 Tax=Pogona vitticeps TaxID=103695 RepID=A0ABM5F722_9SAUR
MSSPPRVAAAAAALALPAWKRTLLERKRAKLAAGLEPAGGPSSPPQAEEEEKKKPGKEPEAREAAEEAEEEPRVVAESLGPLRENPFMRLESERRRRRRRKALPSSPPREKPSPPPPPPPPPPATPASPAPSSPPLSQLLELYSSMPGIRTIRADNILIIESRGETEEAGRGGPRLSREVGGGAPVPPGRLRQDPPPQRSPASPRQGKDPLRALLARAGSRVTEIRAAEVVLYEPRPAGTPPPPPEGEPGRVSRLLQKFDRRAREAGGRGRWRGGDAPRLELAVSNAGLEDGPSPPAATTAALAHPDSPGRLQPASSTFVQKIGSNSFTVNPRGHRFGPVPSELPATAASGLSNGPLEPEETPLPASPPGDPSLPVAAAAVSSKPVPSPGAAAVAATSSSSPARANWWKPKPEGAAGIPPRTPPSSSASPVSSATTTTTSAPGAAPPLASSNGSFEIRPASKPDLAAIPAHDLQAQALAGLRLNSRNSFLFVPCRKGEAAGAPEPSETLPDLPEEKVLPAAPPKPVETLVPVTYIDEDLVESDSGPLPPLRVLSPRLEGFVPQEGSLALEMDDSALPVHKPPPAGFATFAQKGTNTFTIVPKRKPPTAGLETFSRAWLSEEDEEEEESRSRARTGAPHQELGQLLKKRYPTVNEIEVIGGYLSLDKSCMSKSGSRRKKMKISFNESSLQTMFEYPSESSLVEEEEEDEEEEEEYATEVDEPPAPLFIPRPNSPAHSSVTNSGLSSYTPKHSIEFSKWQEQHHEGMPPRPGAFPRDADPLANPVMLTPADKSSLSDFSSEPALYF